MISAVALFFSEYFAFIDRRQELALIQRSRPCKRPPPGPSGIKSCEEGSTGGIVEGHLPEDRPTEPGWSTRKSSSRWVQHPAISTAPGLTESLPSSSRK